MRNDNLSFLFEEKRKNIETSQSLITYILSEVVILLYISLHNGAPSAKKAWKLNNTSLSPAPMQQISGGPSSTPLLVYSPPK